MLKYFIYTDEEGKELEVLLDPNKVEQYNQDNPHLTPALNVCTTINTVKSATFLDGKAPNSRRQAIMLEKEIASLKVIEAGTNSKKRTEISKAVKEAEGKRKGFIETNKDGQG
jgi:hypothetical protein